MINKKEHFDESYYREWLCDRYTFNEERKSIVKHYLSIVLKRKGEIRKILDIGCGFGYFLNACLEAHIPEVYGIEISPTALKYAKNIKNVNVNIVDISKDKTPFESDFFDVITAFDVIEHVHINREKTFFYEVFRILKKGGLIFFVTPNGDSIPRDIYMKLIYGKDDPTHININGWKHWRDLLHIIGFNKIDIKGTLIHGFPPTTYLRGKFKKMSIVKPILFPIQYASKILDRLFIFATK